MPVKVPQIHNLWKPESCSVSGQVSSFFGGISSWGDPRHPHAFSHQLCGLHSLKQCKSGWMDLNNTLLHFRSVVLCTSCFTSKTGRPAPCFTLLTDHIQHIHISILQTFRLLWMNLQRYVSGLILGWMWYVNNHLPSEKLEKKSVFFRTYSLETVWLPPILSETTLPRKEILATWSGHITRGQERSIPTLSTRSSSCHNCLISQVSIR